LPIILQSAGKCVPLQAVKRVFNLFGGLILSIVFCVQVSAQDAEAVSVAYFDSVEVSLLTCSPHEEIYSLYGHTALRWHDLHTNSDLAFNWGVFDFRRPHFVARFVFGLTDYELGVVELEPFVDYYRHWGSMITEQVLNLTSYEKCRLERLLAENYSPANRIYRYNFFYDNCSTRPRDIIERCLDGRIVYEPRRDYQPTFRQMIREKTVNHPWATFGNDMLLGVGADMKTTHREQEFLPENLLYDFDHATVLGHDGGRRQLVMKRRMALEGGVQVVEPDFLLSPTEISFMILVVIVLLTVGEFKRHRTYKYVDVVLMTFYGLVGCLLTVMLFSQHPTTSTNLQWVLINPVHLWYIPAVFKRRSSRYWWLVLSMLVVYFVLATVQQYPEGMLILALCLLLRVWSNLKNEK
jgi:hypothetical protein